MANPQQSDESGSGREPAVSEAVAATEAYETDEGVVFYDAENPLAWIQTDAVFDLHEAD